MYSSIWFGFEKDDDDWMIGTFTVSVWHVLRGALSPGNILVMEATQVRRILPGIPLYSSHDAKKLSTFGQIAYPDGPSDYSHPDEWYIYTADEFERLVSLPNADAIHWIDFPGHLPLESVKEIVRRCFQDDWAEELTGRELVKASGGKLSCYFDGVDSRVYFADEEIGVELLRANIQVLLDKHPVGTNCRIRPSTAKSITHECMRFGGIFKLKGRDVSITNDGYQMVLKSGKKEILVTVSGEHSSLAVSDRRRRFLFW